MEGIINTVWNGQCTEIGTWTPSHFVPLVSSDSAADPSPSDSAAEPYISQPSISEADHQISVVETQRGWKAICLDGFMYLRQSNKVKELTRWRCIKRAQKCPGALHTSSDLTRSVLLKEHNHPSNQIAIEVTKCRNNMKRRAAESHDKPCVIYADAVKNLSVTARAHLPNPATVKRDLRNQHTRQQQDKLRDLNIDGKWKTIGGTSPEPFLFFDNARDRAPDEPDPDSRVIAFGTDQCLKILANSEKWFMDGNFAISPKHLMQVGSSTI